MSSRSYRHETALGDTHRVLPITRHVMVTMSVSCGGVEFPAVYRVIRVTQSGQVLVSRHRKRRAAIKAAYRLARAIDR